jgi:hypothetical protein
MAGFLCLRMLPAILFAPIIGAIADKAPPPPPSLSLSLPSFVLSPAAQVDKRLALIACDVAAAVAVGLMLLLALVDRAGPGDAAWLPGGSGPMLLPAFFVLVPAPPPLLVRPLCALCHGADGWAWPPPAGPRPAELRRPVRAAPGLPRPTSPPHPTSARPCPASPGLTRVQVCLGARQLKLATTVDASVWSALMSLGAALGGLIATTLGLTANFAADALTYLASAALLTAMPPVEAPADGDGAPPAGGGGGAGAGSRGTGARLCDGALFAGGGADPEAAGAGLRPLGPYLRSKPRLLLLLVAKCTGALTWGLAELLEIQVRWGGGGGRATRSSRARPAHRCGGDSACLAAPTAPVHCRLRTSRGFSGRGARRRPRSRSSTPRRASARRPPARGRPCPRRVRR